MFTGSDENFRINALLGKGLPRVNLLDYDYENIFYYI